LGSIERNETMSRKTNIRAATAALAPEAPETRMTICGYCGEALEAVDGIEVSTCPYCHKSLEDNPKYEYVPLMTCPDCGKKISKKATFCVHCGRPMRTSFSEKIYLLLKWLVIISFICSICLGMWYGCEMRKLERSWNYGTYRR
jgi:predicted amidophosphoribosyltransferase